MLSIQYISKFT